MIWHSFLQKGDVIRAGGSLSHQTNKPEKTASQHWNEGVHHYKAKEYAHALESWSQAAQLGHQKAQSYHAKLTERLKKAK